VMLQQSSHWHIAMPSGGGIHAINRVVRQGSGELRSKTKAEVSETVGSELNPPPASQVTLHQNRIPPQSPLEVVYSVFRPLA
jgi:hypothetical protein